LNRIANVLLAGEGAPLPAYFKKKLMLDSADPNHSNLIVDDLDPLFFFIFYLVATNCYKTISYIWHTTHKLL
jgi:hypothetical protein